VNLTAGITSLKALTVSLSQPSGGRGLCASLIPSNQCWLKKHDFTVYALIFFSIVNMPMEKKNNEKQQFEWL